MTMQQLIFQWDIKSFVDCDLVINEYCDSPRFSITNPTFKSDWKLRMYPAGVKKRKNLCFLLLRLDDGSTFHKKHSISILNRNGNRIETESCSELCENSKFIDSSNNIEEAKNIVEIRKNAHMLLNDGVLSVLCEVDIYEKSHEMEAAMPLKILQMRGTSWVIRNVYELTDLVIKCECQKFYLPYGKLALCIEFQCTNFGAILMRIIDKIHPEINVVPVKVIYKGIQNTETIVRVDEDVVPNTTASPDTSLAISARCIVESIPDAFLTDITPYMRKMQTDFRNMFSKAEGGDTSIEVNDKTIRVHKDILSSRSPVFAAMFSQEWREQTTQTVVIKDLDYKTILAMIEFIYFGGGDDDNDYEEGSADPIELLKAAHRYQLDDLKSKCEQRLCKNLKKSNFVRYLALAEVYDLESLKNEAVCLHTHY